MKACLLVDPTDFCLYLPILKMLGLEFVEPRTDDVRLLVAGTDGFFDVTKAVAKFRTN